MTLESLNELRASEFVGMHKSIGELADAIQAEVDESYIPLPLDAEGVLIRIGDTVREVDDRVPMKVMSLTYYEDCVDVNACGMNPKLLVHAKPRTVEDVLRDFLSEYEHRSTDEFDAEMVSKYAAELQMRGDAE